MDIALGFRRARPGFGHFVFDAWLYLVTPLRPTVKRDCQRGKVAAEFITAVAS